MAVSTSGMDFSLNGGNLDFVIYQGKTLGWGIEITSEELPIDISALKARMQLRKHQKSTDYIAEFTTENGRIEMGSDGIMWISMASADSAELPIGTGYYDIKIIDPDDVTDDPEGRVMQIQSGQYQIIGEITR